MRPTCSVFERLIFSLSSECSLEKIFTPCWFNCLPSGVSRSESSFLPVGLLSFLKCLFFPSDEKKEKASFYQSPMEKWWEALLFNPSRDQTCRDGPRAQN